MAQIQVERLHQPLSFKTTTSVLEECAQKLKESSVVNINPPPPLYHAGSDNFRLVQEIRDLNVSRTSPMPSRAASIISPTSSPHTTQQASTITTTLPERFYLRAASSLFMFFTCGWGDGVTGTVLPYFKADYNLSYMTSSLLFITSTAGFALGVLLIEHVLSFMGRFHVRNNRGTKCCIVCLARFRVLVTASILHACFFIIMGTSRGFASVLGGYSIAAFARAFLTGSANAYIASTPKRPFGLLHACWALGAFVAPFVCQTLLAKGIPWTHFYLGSLVLSCINTTFLILAFRPTRKDYEDEGIDRSPYIPTSIESSPLNPEDVDGKRKAAERSGIMISGKSNNSSWVEPPVTARNDSLRYALSLRYVWAFCLFVWIYSGSETTTQGYMATYLLSVRHGNPKTVGYVTSGFWGGMAISRFITGIVSPHLSFTQRKHIIHILMYIFVWEKHILSRLNTYIAIGFTMHLLIWFVNSVFENAFSTAVVGLVYGPIFPSVLALATELLPKEVHLIAMAVICGFANLGSSLFPFLTGAMSNIRGPRVLVFVTVAQTGTLILLWILFPSKSCR